MSGGSADLEAALKPHLFQLFSRGIARVAVDSGALIIDGGTQAGVMEIIGQGVAERGRKSPLLGIAPAGKVTYPGWVQQMENALAKVRAEQAQKDKEKPSQPASAQPDRVKQ